MDETKTKMMKLGKILHIILLIFRGLMIVLGAILLGAIVVMNVTDINLPKISTDLFMVGFNIEQSGDIALTKEIITVSFIALSVDLIMAFVITHFLDQVFKSIAEGNSPFDANNIKALTNSARTGIAYIFIPGIALFVSGALLAPGVGFDYEINSELIFFVLVLYFLIRIFAYGAQLQQQADETL
ncbi:MAG: hypothetical protein LBR25_08790 [Erysipelotrichaceae bacterium]|jgi:hypothetical protein|nr:hypothetical protein [Erysipelotrichaceae bacterium]